MKNTKIGFLFVLMASMSLAACSGRGGASNPSSTDGSSSSESTSTSEETYSYDMSSVSFNDKSYVYDGQYHSLMVEGTLPEDVRVTYSSNNSQVNVGEYEITASFTSTRKNYEAIPDMKATLSITAAEYDMSGITFEDKSYIYDGLNHQITIKGNLPTGVTVTYENNKHKDVGTYDAIAHFTGDSNHSAIPDMHATLTILPLEYDMSGVQFKDGEFTYDGKAHSIAVSGDIPDGVEVTYVNNGQIEPGTYEITAVFSGAENYKAPDSMTATLTINKAVYDMSGVTFPDQNLTLEEGFVQPTIQGTLPEGVTVSYDKELTDGGSYLVTASFSGDEVHYEPIPSMTCTVNVTKVITLDAETILPATTFVYDGCYHTLVVGTLPQHVVLSSIKNNTARSKGTYTVTATFDTDSTYFALKQRVFTTTITVVDYNPDTIVSENPVSVKAMKDKMLVTVNKLGSTDRENPVSLVYMQPNEYFTGSDNSNYGISSLTRTSNGTQIGVNYELDSVQTYELDRNLSGFDMLYNKFYLIQNNAILAGPYYAEYIEQLDENNTTILPDGIKGGQVSGYDTVSFAEDLGLDSVIVNARPSDVILASNRDWTGYSYYTHEFNGVEYKFLKSWVDGFDSIALRCASQGRSFSMILYNERYTGHADYCDDIYLYPNCPLTSTTYAFNTTRDISMSHYIAFMEFLAERYSRPDGAYGHISQFVIGNEIDAAAEWNGCFDFNNGSLSIQNYTEEYMRQLRLANAAVKKYCSDLTVYSSWTYYWSVGHHNANSYFAPKAMLTEMARQSKSQGDFNWGLTTHPYNIDFVSDNFDVIAEDTYRVAVGISQLSGNIDTTKRVSWINLEVIDMFLHRDYMKCNGVLRQWMINETGVPGAITDKKPNGLKQQALTIAWVMYKISCLETCIEWNYGALSDTFWRAGYNHELYKQAYGGVTPAYTLYKTIDSEEGLALADTYLGYGSYFPITGGHKSGFTSYLEWLDVVNSGYDFYGHFSREKLLGQVKPDVQ